MKIRNFLNNTIEYSPSNVGSGGLGTQILGQLISELFQNNNIEKVEPKIQNVYDESNYSKSNQNIETGSVEPQDILSDVEPTSMNFQSQNKIKDGVFQNQATRNKNPGNLSGMSGNLLYGATSIANSKNKDAGDRAQLVFDTPEKGWNAMKSLMSSERYNKDGFRQDFSKWQTDQKAFNNILLDMTNKGININKRFIDTSPHEQKIAMNTRARFEGYQGPLLTV